MNETSIRVDRWLWFARMYKSRTLAAKMVQSGKLRINGNLVNKSKQAVSIGDVLTFPKGPHIRILKILQTGTRRGPATEAVGLYEDLSPPENQKKQRDSEQADVRTAPVAKREKGAGRPTKSERRAMEKVRVETLDDLGD